MEAFNFTAASEDCNLYTYDMRKLQTAACVHKVRCGNTRHDVHPTCCLIDRSGATCLAFWQELTLYFFHAETERWHLSCMSLGLQSSFTTCCINKVVLCP